MILAGQTYVNVHTPANGGGEIRGQIAAVLMQTYLNGVNERPLVYTLGNGIGTFTLVRDQLGFNLTYADLSGAATLNHIHGPASSTQNANVLIDLAPYNGGAFGVSGGTAGRVTLTPQNLAYVIDGLTYVNYHTAANGSGEIRGQVVR